jgi:1,4-alpha-glucan branching enzyme
MMMKTNDKKSVSRKIKNNLEKKTGNQGVKKQYLKNNNMCKVTFTLPKETTPDTKDVTIVGNFNNWNTSETPMKKLKSGDFSITLNLPQEREYRFNYLVDSNRWGNDWHADRYIPNSYGG